MNPPVADLDAYDRRVRHALYRFFVEEGHAPVASELAKLVGGSPIEIEESLRRLNDAHVIVLAPGTPYIWMANPLSALPTPYRVETGGKRFWANCIWDALGRPG